MTNMDGGYQPENSNSFELQDLRQKLQDLRRAIAGIEEVLDTTSYDTFTREALKGFGKVINDAIHVVRKSKRLCLCGNDDSVLEYLRQAKTHAQLAVDEFDLSKKANSRYKFMNLTGADLRQVLVCWPEY